MKTPLTDAENVVKYEPTGFEGKEYARAGGREGTVGASPWNARAEGVPELRGGNAPPAVPVMDEECGKPPNSGGTTDSFCSP